MEANEMNTDGDETEIVDQETEEDYGECPRCGEPLYGDSRYCHKCGEPLFEIEEE